MGSYSIKDLERISGIKAHTLRIWEQRYEILKPNRTDTNIRTYSDDDLKRILNISILNQQGVKISKLAKLNTEQLFKQVIDSSDANDSKQVQVDNLVIAMVEMDEDRFDKYFSTCILRHGFEQSINDVIYPFLQKVGLLWQTNSINPAQEHFISNLIRQKLIVAIDGTQNSQTDGGKKFLLYLPENEMHEISLLFANYKVRYAHHKSIYLGQSVPYADLKMVYNLHKPDYILTILTCSLFNETLQDYCDRLAADFHEAKILVSGSLLQQQTLDPASNVLIFNNMEFLNPLLAEL